MRHDHLVDEIEARSYDSHLMRRLLVYLRPYRWQAAAAVALLLLMTPLELAGPYIVKTAIDRHIQTRDPAGLGTLALIFLAISALTLVIRYAQSYITQWVGQRAMMDLRMDLFTHIERLPLSRFDRTPVGTLMTRVGSDVEVLQEMFSAGVITVFGDVFTLVGIIAFMLWINAPLALISFTVMPILLVATLLFRSRVREAFRIIRRKVAALSAHLQESITGMMTIQLFGRERDSRERYARLAREHQEAFLKAIFYYSVFLPLVEVIGALAAALLIYFGGGRIIRGALTLGALVAFIEYTSRFFSPIQDLSEKYNILQSAMAAAERTFGLLDTPLQEETRGEPCSLPPPVGRVEFREVRFAYQPGEEVLKGVSFSVAPGETVAIVGATGAGKTSIVGLLARLYEPMGGEIILDGCDIRRIPLHELRGRVGLVLQDVFLFSGSVVDNIILPGPARILHTSSIPAPGSTGIERRERAAAILENLGALEMFLGLPEGLDTPLRERASLLSVGQKQLLAFARALAYDPPVLVLDEATSSLDTDTEQAVQEALERLKTDRTAIVIAHRLSTIRNAHRIIVMHHGAVAEAGTHAELLARRGLYHRLHRIQFDIEEPPARETAPG